MWPVFRFINQNHKYLYCPHFGWISPHIFPWIHCEKRVVSYLCKGWFRKSNFTNKQTLASVLVGTRSLLQIRRCVVASLVDLRVPKGRAKVSKLLNHLAPGRPHMACARVGEQPIGPKSKLQAHFWRLCKDISLYFLQWFHLWSLSSRISLKTQRQGEFEVP